MLRQFGPLEDRKTKIHLIVSKLIKMFIPDYIKPGLYMYNQPLNINIKSFIKGIPQNLTSLEEFAQKTKLPLFSFSIQHFFSLMKLSNIKTLKMFIANYPKAYELAFKAREIILRLLETRNEMVQILSMTDEIGRSILENVEKG